MCDNTCTTDCGKCKGGLQYRYEFQTYDAKGKPSKKVWSGPYPTRRDAEAAFQGVYSFHPLFTGKREVY